MISVLGTTNKYILQNSLVDMHQQTQIWMSAADFWKRELSFFQKMLDRHAPHGQGLPFKQQVDHFQNLITYYQGEVIDAIRKQLRQHEHHLANMLKENKEADTTYFKEHEPIIVAAASFEKSFLDFKHEFYSFLEKDN